VYQDRAVVSDRNYSGTFATINTLTPGSYKVTAQAVDQSGRVSKEVSTTFKVLAAPVPLSVTVTPPEVAANARFTLDGGVQVALAPTQMSDGTTGYNKTLYVEPNVQHTIVFSPVTGYTAPKAIQFVIPAGTTDPTPITGDYQKTGFTRTPATDLRKGSKIER
jgi:hypothetical protein